MPWGGGGLFSIFLYFYPYAYIYTLNSFVRHKNIDKPLYFYRISKEQQLTLIAKAAVAKPSPLTDRLGNPDARDLFDLLVPVAVNQALAAYDVRKSELVNKEVDQLKEATNLLNQLLSSMNPPAALEDIKGKLKVVANYVKMQR